MRVTRLVLGVAAMCCAMMVADDVWGASGKGQLLVGSRLDGWITRFDGYIGEFEDLVGVYRRGSDGRESDPVPALNGQPVDMTVGPDGRLYVTNLDTKVGRFDLTTGEYVDTFISSFDDGLPLERYLGIAFGPDGYLYLSTLTDISRFDAETGEFVDVFFSASDIPAETAANLSNLHNFEDIVFGPDGNLYLARYYGTEVLRIDGQTGDFMDVFTHGGDLYGTRTMLFDDDGSMLVSSWLTGEVLRYDGETGDFLEVFARADDMQSPNGLAFGPTGDLFVVDEFSHRVLRFDGDTGEYRGVFADQYLSYPVGLLFVPEPGTVGLFVGCACLAVGRRRRRG